MDEPLGQWIVGLIGVGFVAAGLYEAWTGLTKKFMEELETHEMSHRTRRMTERFGPLRFVYSDTSRIPVPKDEDIAG